MRDIRVLGNLAALSVTAGLGVFLIILGAGVPIAGFAAFLTTTGGMVLLIVLGTVLIGVGIHFLIAIADERLNASLFVREGEWGRIEVSPFAIREFISGILRDELGIGRFRIRLSHRQGGVGIAVRMTLSPDQRVPEVGESIQRELMRHVAERTGVEVREVSVLVRSIRSDAKEIGDEPPAEP